MASLELVNLKKKFGTLTALNGVSFQVTAGEIFGFVGANGAGKSTTMRIALGVLSADEGEVLWGGTPISSQTRREIGYMPEERGLYPKMTVGKQLIYLARLHGMSKEEATASMLHWTEVLQIAGRRKDQLLALSLGNQQRVQLAAALVHNPKILILDEPFSGLDPVAVEVMAQVLQERSAAGVPVVFSSHQLELVERISSRVGIISNGSMVAVGTVPQLRENASSCIWRIASSALTEAAILQIPGAISCSQTSDGWLVELTSDGDSSQLLSAGISAGQVYYFGKEVPPLTELFKSVIEPAKDAA